VHDEAWGDILFALSLFHFLLSHVDVRGGRDIMRELSSYALVLIALPLFFVVIWLIKEFSWCLSVYSAPR